MAWFKRKPPPVLATPGPPAPLPPATIRACGTVIHVLGAWEQAPVDPGVPIEFRNSALPEQILITERTFRGPIDPRALEEFLRGISDHYRDAVLNASPTATAATLDYRTGNNQGEARLIVLGPDVQAAFLSRGDARRAVSISLYRYPPLSPKFSEYAHAVFDHIEFTPSAS